MKICIPIENDNGLDSLVHWHFGSAPLFMIYDTDSKNTKVIDNSGLAHQEGHCDPILSFKQNPIDMLVVANIGPRALQKLQEGKIKVMQAEVEGKVSDVIKAIEKGVIKEVIGSDSCTHHCDCH